MTTHYPPEIESGTADSVAALTLSDQPSSQRVHEETTAQALVRFMCSFGGKILPRPHDNQLRYAGGDTRIITVHRHTSFSILLSKLSKLSGTNDIIVKYQLPNEDLDALITVTGDEDVENMMEEYDRLALGHSKTARLRLFLFPMEGLSRTSSISSLLDGSTKREHWFLDALNGGSTLERGRSEVSSIVSEVPDYLFGLDNSDDPPRDLKLKTRTLLQDSVNSVSDPGSPTPVISSPFCSTSSSLGPGYPPPIPDLRPVRTRPDNTAPTVVDSKEVVADSVYEPGERTNMQHTDYSGQTTWHYIGQTPSPSSPTQNMPIYYIPGSIPSGNIPIQSVPMAMRTQYVQPFPPPPSQIPVGLHQNQPPTMNQVYGGLRQVSKGDPYDMSGRISDGINQPMYYGIRNTGVPTYPGMVVTGSEEMQAPGLEANLGRIPSSS